MGKCPKKEKWLGRRCLEVDVVSRGDPRQSVWVHTTNALDPHTFAEQGRNWRQEPIGAAGRLYGEDTEEPRIKRPVHRWGQQTQSVGSGGGVPEPAAAAASSSAALNPWEELGLAGAFRSDRRPARANTEDAEADV